MSGPVTIEKEMGITHADFFRILPNALGGEGYAVSGSRITWKDGERTLTIDLGQEESRQIALMRMPKTRLTLTFTGYEADEREAALARFWRYFQKGGG